MPSDEDNMPSDEEMRDMCLLNYRHYLAKAESWRKSLSRWEREHADDQEREAALWLNEYKRLGGR